LPSDLWLATDCDVKVGPGTKNAERAAMTVRRRTAVDVARRIAELRRTIREHDIGALWCHRLGSSSAEPE